MKLARTKENPVVERDGTWFVLPQTNWDDLFRTSSLRRFLNERINEAGAPKVSEPTEDELRAPIGHQEVWAAGVTYTRSRTARIEESEEEEAKDFYDRVYDAERPELFIKSTPHRTVGPGEDVAIREDSTWSVPEPELTVAVSSGGEVLGYTVGNDVCARDIEAENPLYLPQAKVYDRCCAIGPHIQVSETAAAPDGQIELTISRNGNQVYEGDTSLSRLKRTVDELVTYLFRNNSFPNGCLLLTGTGIVPPDEFFLKQGDEVQIAIDGIGTLRNRVAVSSASDPVEA